MRALFFSLVALIWAANCIGQSPSIEFTTSASHIKHVFIIILENKDFRETFSTSNQDPYLQKTSFLWELC